MRAIQDVLENDYGLDLTGWTLTDAHDISEDGTVIVGAGINPNGDIEAWRAVISPLSPPLRVEWNDPDGGDFSDSTNWVGGAVPDELQIAVFDTTIIGSIYEVTFSSNETNYALQVGKNSVDFNLAPSHTYTLSASDSLPAIRIGASTGNIEDSRVFFLNGTVRALGNVDIGVDVNRGELIVTNGGIFEIEYPAGLADNFLRVGVDFCGPDLCGHLEIRSGGIVRSLAGSQIGVNASSEGSVLVTGNGSQWIDSSICDIGVSGKGTITIEQGGSFNGKTVVIGSESTQAEGSITVTGVGSNFTTSASFSIGLLGMGTFNVTNGALAISQAETSLGVNEQAEGYVNVDGMGTVWITFDTLYIGYEGSGGLVVSNGGDVLSSNATISETPTGIGSTQVDGDSSKWTITGNFHVGKAGVGFVQLLNGGVLDNSTGVTIIGPLGSIDISGGTIYVGLVPPVQNRVAGFLDDDTTGELHGETTTVTGGSMFLNTLILEDGATVLADSVVFGEGGTIGGSGTFDFDVTNSGAVTPGGPLAAGTFTVNAGYTQLSSGVLLIELGGLDPGQGHDQLMVTATAQLGGTLDVSAINDFEPQVGQVYEIISANTVTGTFDQIVSHGGLGFDVAYTNNNVSITITSPLGVEDEIEDLIPTDYVLYQNYPNPFNPTTKIKYGIPNSGLITLQVYNLLGEVVTTLVNKQQSAGNYEVSFDAASAAGGLSSGIYLYKIQAGDYSDLKKMILLR